MDLCYADTTASSAAGAQSVDTGDTAAAAAAASATSSQPHLTVGDGMSGSQKELINIMERVKTKRLTMQEAEDFFYDWKRRHESGCSRSFKQKQVCGPVRTRLGVLKN